MAYGIRCWDSGGNLKLDITNRLIRMYGKYSYSIAQNSNTTISVPGITTDGTWMAFASHSCEILSGSVRIYGDPYEAVSGTLCVVRM